MPWFIAGAVPLRFASRRGPGSLVSRSSTAGKDSNLDTLLAQVLKQNGFTGRIDSQLEVRLGRRLNPELVDLGRLLWFDPIHSLHHDNTCAGCHSPTNGFGDTQSIAIGVDNNNKVGPNRSGPRNQRRSPLMINTAFFPKLMWNGRFSANPSLGPLLGNPFSNANGFTFPDPEGTTMFPPGDDIALHLLHAQAFIPPTELVEVGGFNGTCPGGIASPGIFQEQCQFDNGIGEIVPLPDGSGFRNEPIRQKDLQLLNANHNYRTLFTRVFPEAAGGHITFKMFVRAIAEFEFSQTFANAPIDRFARGDEDAMTSDEKRGALVFFGEGRCVTCHAVKGRANEMFSDFENRVAGIPQLAPDINAGGSNMVYDGSGRNEDFGLEQITGDPADRYKFRTAPAETSRWPRRSSTTARLRSWTMRFAITWTRRSLVLATIPSRRGVDKDLTRRLGPIERVFSGRSGSAAAIPPAGVEIGGSGRVRVQWTARQGCDQARISASWFRKLCRAACGRSSSRRATSSSRH